MDFYTRLQSTALPSELSKDLWLRISESNFLSLLTFVAGSSVSEFGAQPGLDTLEENADKRRFFEELEHGRKTPLDYSQLNRDLGETGKSSLLAATR